MVYSMRIIVRQSLGPVMLAVSLSALGGSILNSRLQALLCLPVILMMAPPLNDMAGDFGCIIGSRLSTALHLGLIRPKIIQRSKNLRDDVIALMITGACSSTYLGIVVHVISFITGLPSVDFLRLIGIAFISGMVEVVILTIFSIIASILSYRNNIDPCNVTISLATAVADLTAAASLILASKLLGAI